MNLKNSFPDYDVDTLLTLDVCDAPNITATPIGSIISANQTDEKTQTKNADNVTLADKEADTEEDYNDPKLSIAGTQHKMALEKAKSFTAALIVKSAGGTTDEQKRALRRQQMRAQGRLDLIAKIELDVSKFSKLDEFEKNPIADKTLYDKYLKQQPAYFSDSNYTESNPYIESFELKDWYAELGTTPST